MYILGDSLKSEGQIREKCASLGVAMTESACTDIITLVHDQAKSAYKQGMKEGCWLLFNTDQKTLKEAVQYIDAHY